MMAITQNNVYIHSSPPKAVSGQGAAIRQWVKNGDLEKLENVVLEGQGARLLGLMESTGDTKVKAFLRSIPGYMAKVDLIHDAVVRGSLRETQALIDKRKLATARDAVGRGVGHKAVLYNHKAVVEWLAKKYPETIQIKDNESRTPLHYTASLTKDSEDMYDLLVNLGANTEAVDIHGRKAIYYVSHPEELDIEGPNNATQNNRSFSRGKRRKISPISPKVAGMSPNITRAQIRIWIHERDISKLERIVWAGNGDKLLLETTNNAKIRKFLDNVPHLLSRIKSIHKAAIHNDVDSLKDLKRKTEVDEVFTAKDSHGLTAMHKAAGLGHRIAVEFFVLEAGSLINEPDNEGKTPLHYAAKDATMYNFLKRSGADETIPDLKGRTPSYYRSHQTEFDTRYLRHIPDAPRVSGDIIGWDRGFSPQSLSQKRKISSGEFSGDGNADAEKEEPENDDPITMESILASATKVRRTSDVEEEDIGKYDLSTNFDIRPEEDAGDGNAEMPPSAPSPVPPKSTPQTPKASPVPPKSPVPPESSPAPPKSPVPPQSSPVPPKSSPRPPSSPKPPQSSPRPPSSPKPPKSSPRPPSSPKPPRDSPFPQDPSPGPPEEAEKDVEVEAEEKPEPPPEPKKKSAYRSPYLNRPAPPPKDPEPEGEPEPEEDIEEYIKKGDMEKLVDRVLEGRGNELVGKDSDNPEVQEFLLNVPAYMAKIASIHNAASSGNLRDLQSLLDRKRLALAQDEHGRGPLHKAVLHYHPAVVRYMASNYPQALTLVDKNKRSALHYAATLPDSGVMYKTLIQTGADPNVKDKIGNTPGIYLRRKDLLTHAELLSANPAAAAPKSVKRNKSSVDTWERPPSTLQDKKVTSQPPAPEIETTELSTLETYYHQISKEEGLWARTWRKLLLTSAQNSTTAKAYVKKYLTEEIFQEIKTRSTPRYGATLLDCIKFFPQYFLVAPDPHCYMTFKEVFIPAIRDHNGQQTVPIIHPAMVFQGQIPLQEDIPVVDLPSKFVDQVRVRLSRNIRPFAFVSLFKKEDLMEVHLLLTKLLTHVGPDWDLFELETLDKEQRDELINSRNLLIPDATKISRFWPKSRAFMLSPDNSIQLWINSQDHLDVIVMGRYGRLCPIMQTLDEIYTKLASHVEFHYNSQIGFLTADPFRCGTAMKITFRIRLPFLMLARSDLIAECEKLHLTIKWKKGYTRTDEISPDDWIELENVYTYGFNENEIAVNTAKAVNELIKMEEALARTAVLAITKPKKSDEEALIDSPGTDGDGEKSQFPAIWSEEGKYLASVLGDALVKGLTQVSQERPDDPVEYLANFLRGYRKGEAEMIVQNNVIDEKMEEDGAPEEEKMETEEEENGDALAIAAAAVPVAAAAAAAAATVHEIQSEEAKPEEAANEEAAETAAAPEEEVMETAAEEEAPQEAEEAPPEENPEPQEEEMPAAAEEEAPAEEPVAAAAEGEPPTEEEVAAEEVKEEQEETKEEENAVAPEGGEEEVPAGDPEGEAEEDQLIQRLEDEVEQEDEDDEDAIHTVTGDEETDAAITTEHSGTRDDRGQSVLHFAAARPGGASTILAFLQNPSVNLAWRDEKLRTARDVAEGLNRTENVQTIDSWIVSLASSGEQETLEKLMMDGYKNILTVQDSSHAHIVEVAEKANQRSVALFLRSIPDFQEKLLKLHRVVRHGSLEQAKEILQTDGKLAAAMSPWGRCILHTAVLVEQHPIVQFVAQTFPECLRRGDSLERTALHYAMGIEKVEKMTRILVRAGAKRVVKDLRGRQPSYYFINREEIAQLQREEEQLKLANA